jgi:hypothetical protein
MTPSPVVAPDRSGRRIVETNVAHKIGDDARSASATLPGMSQALLTATLVATALPLRNRASLFNVMPT